MKDLPPPAPAAKPAAKAPAAPASFAMPPPSSASASKPAAAASSLASVEVRGGHAFPATPGVVLTPDNAVIHIYYTLYIIPSLTFRFFPR